MIPRLMPYGTIASKGIPQARDPGVSQRIRAALQDKLLALGGERVVFDFDEPYGEELLARGELSTRPVVFRESTRSDSHANAARDWECATTLVRLHTGYALATGVWRRHSWAVRDDNIIETIAKADYYFGIELDEREAVKFWLANLHVYRYPHWAPSASYVQRHARIFQKIEEYGLLEIAGV